MARYGLYLLPTRALTSRDAAEWRRTMLPEWIGLLGEVPRCDDRETREQAGWLAADLATMAEATWRAAHGGGVRFDRRSESHGHAPARILFGLFKRSEREGSLPLLLDNALGELRALAEAQLREQTRPMRERALDRLRDETGRALRAAPLAEIDALANRLRGAAEDRDADLPAFGNLLAEAIGEAIARYRQTPGRHRAEVENPQPALSRATGMHKHGTNAEVQQAHQ